MECLQRQRPGALQGNRLVECHESLKWRIGPDPADAGKISIGRVKSLEQRMRYRAVTEGVNPPLESFGAFVLRPNLWPVTNRGHKQETGQRRKDASPADRRIQQPASLQRHIANDFRVHPQSRSTSEEPVVWISAKQFRSHLRCLPA